MRRFAKVSNHRRKTIASSNPIAHVLGARGPPRLRLQRPLVAPRVPAILGSHTSATFATHTGGGSQIARIVTKFPSVFLFDAG